MFSRSCEYALQAILYISLNQVNGQKRLVPLNEIASSQEMPPHFLSKVLQNLVKDKILNSTKGPTGGFSLNVPSDKLTLMEVVRAIDGLDIFDRCGIGLRECSDENPCPIHFDYKIVKNRIRQILSQKTISELTEDVESGHAIVNFKKHGKKRRRMRR